MATRTKLATLLTPDSPIALAATWFLDRLDRQYIDDQIRTLQYYVVGSARGQIVTTAVLNTSSAAVAVGDCLCLANRSASESDPMTDTRYVTRAVTASMANAGVVCGIALTAASPGGQLRMAVGGIVGYPIARPNNSGAQPVRVNLSTGRCQAVASLFAGDYQVGFCNQFGDVT